MICVAVTRIKNEADIIEPFIRHHAKYFDAIIVSEDASTDESFGLLEKMQRQGLPLTLIREPCVGFEQSRFMTRLMHRAFEEFGADWVAPLDADEFIELPDSAALADLLPKRPDCLLEIPWNNFAWSKTDQSGEVNPVVRLRWRMSSRQAMKKILVPAAIGRDETAILWPGNHGLNRGGVDEPTVECPQINLCHYPIRSVAQFTRKVIINYLQFAAYFGHKSGAGHQYDDAFDLLKRGLVDEFQASMEGLSRRYSPPLDALKVEEPPTLAPLRYVGGPLEFTTPSEELLPHLLCYAEALADRIFALARDASTRHAEKEKTTEFLSSTLASHAAEIERWKQDNLELRRVSEEATAKMSAIAEKAGGLEQLLKQEQGRLADLNSEISAAKAACLAQADELSAAEASYSAQADQLNRFAYVVALPFKLLLQRLSGLGGNPPR
jgi:hypothetical protein